VREIPLKLQWKNNKAPKYVGQSRNKEIDLKYEFGELKWKKFSEKNGRIFKYLLIETTKNQISSVEC
jgi:hypothetical protein